MFATLQSRNQKFNMREFKSNNEIVQNVTNEIWYIYNSLRGGLNTQDFDVILLLLSAYKDGLLDLTIHDYYHGIKNLIIERMSSSGKYNNIISEYKSTLGPISGNVIEVLVNELQRFDKDKLKENFPEIFDDLLYKFSKAQGRTSGEFIQPVELTRFIIGLADLRDESNIFNPFAGLASFGVYLDKGENYFGQEFNKRTWALGTLRLLAHNKLNNSQFDCDNSIFNWPAPNQKFDLVLAHPPFNVRLNKPYSDINPNIKTAEQFLIEKGLESLNFNGKLITILPLGFLFRGSYDLELRRKLIELDLIDTIIFLPGGLLSNTGIPLVILLLNNNKNEPGIVRFVDASKFVEVKGTKDKVLNDFELNELLKNNTEKSGIIKFVSNDKIIANEYNLSVPRYFESEIILAENENSVKLGDIIKPYRGQRASLPEIGKLIRIRDLKDDNVDFLLDDSNIEETELNRHNVQQIEVSCLLLAIRWKTLKPTFFEFKGNPIFKSQDVFSAKIDESRVDKAYLINELQSVYVEKQLNSYRLGATIPFIRQDDLLEVVIKLPSLEEQRAKVQGIYELATKIKTLQEERNALAHGKSINNFNEFASLKHTLGRPRQNILDWSDNLLDFINKNQSGFKEMNKAFVEFYDVDMMSVLKEIKQDVNFITEVLEKGENGLVLSAYEKQIIPLSDINTIINDLSNNGYNFKIKKLLLKAENTKERGIFANRTLFKTLLDNLLTNANKYAFDEKKVANEVVIELAEVDDFLVLEVKNNGKLFPKNFDREKFIAKYSTADTSSGSGLGGYDIHRIASNFNNPEWELSLNEDPIYPVKFKFQFPIKLIN